MNILQAKEQIKNSVKAYLMKDEYERYIIPQAKQRPILLMGPPGIGKTEIVHQVAEEMGIGLLSYAMTHHTRQSALGLPIIKNKVFKGEEKDVSEYTVSEIIADVYSLTEETGIENGILFLDEINCVSETLMPVILQFLQYKVFGSHKLPEGWIVVAAGNPPEYNFSAREFDVAVLDRLKVINVKESFGVWKEYAGKIGIHRSILTYLELNTKNFYLIERGSEGVRYVTARGWEDLSRMLKVCEEANIVCDETLVSQYIGNDEIASDFYIHYDLYNKYKKKYAVDDILEGRASAFIKETALKAGFNERYSLLGMLTDTIKSESKAVLSKEDNYTEILNIIKTVKEGEVQKTLSEKTADIKERKQRLKRAEALSYEEERRLDFIREKLTGYILKTAEGDIEELKKVFAKDIEELKDDIKLLKHKYSNMFTFCTDIYDVGNEALVLVTELTADPYCAKFLSYYGCDEYKQISEKLMLKERRTETIKKIDSLLDNYEG
ncbi:MAG: AAA family ATPase [Firmicutes bacterium]|nr:AAA family ATPase [Bacillota bacterium]